MDSVELEHLSHRDLAMLTARDPLLSSFRSIMRSAEQLAFSLVKATEKVDPFPGSSARTVSMVGDLGSAFGKSLSG